MQGCWMKNLGEILFRATVGALSRLPLPVHYALCSVIAFIAEHLVRYRRTVVERNIENSFPDRTEREHRAIRHGFYRHFGEIIAETIWLGSCKAGDPRVAGFMSAENAEILQEAWKDGRSMMIMTSHAGNWELMGMLFDCDVDLPFIQSQVGEVYKKLKSPMWDRFMQDNRTTPLKGTGFKNLIESNDVLRFAVRHRDEQLLYVFPNDQYPYKGAAFCEIENFMNQPTRALVGGAQLASKLDMSVVFLGIRRDRRGHYTYVFDMICLHAGEMTAQAIMEGFYERLQRDLEAQPENYLWSHKRWKQIENNYKKK